MEMLSALGVPVYTERGHAGECSLTSWAPASAPLFERLWLLNQEEVQGTDAMQF